MTVNRSGKKLLILTVGTSLLTNDGGKKRNEFTLLDAACENLKTDHIVQYLGKHLAGEALQKELSFRCPGHREKYKKDRLPQELSYLALLAEDKEKMPDGEVWQVALLSSDSEEGILCANVIFKLLSDPNRVVPWNRFEIEGTEPYTISGLKVIRDTGESDSTFASEGVPHLISQIRSFRAGGWSQIVLNMTGGFKGIIPFSTLASHFLESDSSYPPIVRQHYLFEETDYIVDLPVYPIGLDFASWHRQAALLEAALALPDPELRRVYWDALDCRMQAVALELQRNEGKYVAGSLPDVLRECYEHQLGHDPLQHFSEQVIRQFLPDDTQFQQRLLQLVRSIGPRIWYGDKLVMGADHASRHHHDLLEIAQLLLTPVAFADCQNGSGGPFLTEEERFVLLCAVLLHDCGHSLDALPQRRADGTEGPLVPLFTSEVRELHQFLAWRRLHGCSADRDLQWDPDQPLADAVSELCVYHRRRTGWDQNLGEQAGKQYCPYLERKFSPPTEVKFDSIDFPKLVCLLRLIDGCDNQSRRAGRGADARMLLEGLKRDQQTWLARLKAAESAAWTLWQQVNGPERPLLESLHLELARPSPETSTLKGLLGTYSDGPFWETRRQLGKMMALGTISAEESARTTLWLDTFRCLDEYLLRAGQEIHSIKHQAISRILIVPTGDFKLDALWSFEIRMYPTTTRIVPDRDYPEGILDSRAFMERFHADTGNIKPFDGSPQRPPHTLREWITHEIASELQQENIEYLACASGRNWKVCFTWMDEDTGVAVHRHCISC